MYQKHSFISFKVFKLYVIIYDVQHPESETTFGTEKFPQKTLIWQAICECGLKSSPYVATRTMDTDLYINECLKKRLLPFIAQHNVPCFFWPDLAPMHYSRATLQFCKDNDINIVPTVANQPNVPEDRPIKTYWKLIKDELKKEPRAAQDDQDFKYRWKRASSRIAEETIKSMMSTVRQKIKFRSQMERMVESEGEMFSSFAHRKRTQNVSQ